MSDRKCFVIAPIGDPDSEIRKRSDQVLKHVVKPAVTECGYSALRADEIAEPGLITSQVIQHLVDDPLVVADLTDRNPNVFYELAIRHAIRKPLVQIIRKGEQIPFDVAGMRTIPLDHRDLDSVEEAKIEMIRQIKSFERADAKIDTPVSVSLDLQILRQSDNPEQRTLADLLSTVADLHSAIASLEKRLPTTDEGFGRTVVVLVQPNELTTPADWAKLCRVPLATKLDDDLKFFLSNDLKVKEQKKPKSQ